MTFTWPIIFDINMYAAFRMRVMRGDRNDTVVVNLEKNNGSGSRQASLCRQFSWGGDCISTWVVLYKPSWISEEILFNYIPIHALSFNCFATHNQPTRLLSKVEMTGEWAGSATKHIVPKPPVIWRIRHGRPDVTTEPRPRKWACPQKPSCNERNSNLIRTSCWEMQSCPGVPDMAR
jgi:hypothetical protein